MKQRISFNLIFCLFLFSIGNNSARAVDYQDYRTPIIQEIKQNYAAVYENGENFLEISYEMKVKTFSNPLSSAIFNYVYFYKDYPVGCQLIPTNWGPLIVSYGNKALKLDSLVQPSGLVKIEKFNGYQLETHNFTFTTKVMRSSLNTKFKFCDQLLKLEIVNLWDTAGHSNSINYNHSNYFGPFYNTYPEIPYQSFKEAFSQKQLPNDFCPNLSVPYDWYTSEKLYSVCNHSNSLATLSISLSPSQNDLAKVEADKAAAEKAAAGKAAQDKVAADKAEIRNLLDSVANQIASLKLKYGANIVRVQQSTLDRLNLAFQVVNESGYSEIHLLAQKVQSELLALEQVFAKEKSALKKTTITCIKGKVAKKVTAVNAKCPAGYKKK